MESSLASRIAGYDGRNPRGRVDDDDDDDRTVLDKISSVATDLVSKVESTVSHFGNQKPTEENPVNYKVIHKGGALVRSGQDTSSGQVHQLSANEVVSIVEICGRRARLVHPVDGWISLETKDGVQIMRQCTLQRKGAKAEAFEASFERKFQRIKAQTGGVGYDPRAERSDDSRSPSPRDTRDRRSDRDYRDDRDDRRRKEPYDPPAQSSKRYDDDRDYRDRRD